MEKCGMRYVGIEEAPGKYGSDEQVLVKCYEISQK